MSTPALATAAEGATRIILVHGTGHGGWCWYRVATLLRAAGHRVDALDLAASGIDSRQLRDVPTFEDYTRPLLDALRALLPGERAVLVGHSFGGMNIALAAEMFPEKVAAAVFVTAFLPDCSNPRSHVIEKVTVPDWMDTVTDAEHAPPSVFLGPEFLRHKLYQLSPPEDYTLSQSLARDQAMTEAYQQMMIAGCPVAEVREIADADHMAMFSAPAELAGHLAHVANTYA
ncbi:unnamed protein product [Miscanthus lutarioriparius]|uniref:AB hydrolase-1 domain-containing protein n=1 Tax=Miscanthus lutarioriparius TaxID=422564 RepID=A0A811P0B7_9POAL|nr:unnamed protein product [Miscanthus lutarioriparius]